MNQQIYKKELKQYFKQVRKNLLLIYSHQYTKSIMQMLKQNTVSFFEENPTATFEDFKTQFGDPENLSADMFEMEFSNNQSPNVSSFSYKKRCIQVIATGVAICALILAAFYGKAYIDCLNEEIIYKETTIKSFD